MRPRRTAARSPGRICPNTSLESGDTSTPRFSLRLGIRLRELLRDVGDVGLRLRERDAGREPRERRECRGCRALRGACGGDDAIIDTHTSLASDRPLNARRRDADDREDLVVRAESIGRSRRARGRRRASTTVRRSPRRAARRRRHPPTSSRGRASARRRARRSIRRRRFRRSRRSGAPLPYMMKPLSLHAENRSNDLLFAFQSR